jgi:hypothetical protein
MPGPSQQKILLALRCMQRGQAGTVAGYPVRRAWRGPGWISVNGMAHQPPSEAADRLWRFLRDGVPPKTAAGGKP